MQFDRNGAFSVTITGEFGNSVFAIHDSKSSTGQRLSIRVSDAQLQFGNGKAHNGKPPFIHIDSKWIVIYVILHGIKMIVVPLIENIDIDFCTAGNGLVAIRNFSFGDSSRRIPDNSVGTRVFLRRNIQQNITVCTEVTSMGVIARSECDIFCLQKAQSF